MAVYFDNVRGFDAGRVFDSDMQIIEGGIRAAVASLEALCSDRPGLRGAIDFVDVWKHSDGNIADVVKVKLSARFFDNVYVVYSDRDVVFV